MNVIRASADHLQDHSAKSTLGHSGKRRRLPALSGIVAVLILGHFLVQGPLWSVGETPSNPLTLQLDGPPRSLSIGSNGTLWLRTSFSADSCVSHLQLETLGSLDTTLSVYSDLETALANDAMVVDDDSGSGFNAKTEASLGFASPYLIKLTSLQAGTLQLRGQHVLSATQRCDWPSGCSLALAAKQQPNAGQVLRTLRQVRGKVLSQTPQGRHLTALYWQLSADLLPELLIDSSLREDIYRRVQSLSDLAEEATAAASGRGGRLRLSRHHIDQLRSLYQTLLPHLTASNRREIEDLWQKAQLDSWRQQPLSDVLQGLDLLPETPKRVAVAFKAKTQPSLSKHSASGQLLTEVPEIDAMLSSYEAKSISSLHRPTAERIAAGLTRAVVAQVEDEALALQLVTELRDSGSVEWAEVVAEVGILGSTTDDPYRSDLWGLDAIDASGAWNTTRGNCGTRVAIVDTGFKAGLADLSGRLLQNLGYDFAEDDPDPDDRHGHGTHVGGTVAAAADNGVSIAGVAPQVCIFAVKVLDDEGNGSSTDVAAGIVHATDAGANVINLSLGCDCAVQQSIEDALEYAASRDVVVAAAAGNDSLDYLGYPASSVWTIAVGAVDESLELASFSNYGPGIDLVAPGVDIASLFKDGESCLGSGTSMATPHVAGVAALVRSADPGLSRTQVSERLREHAVDLGSPGYDSTYGSGLVDASASLQGLGGSCQADTCLLLQGGRFEVRVDWRDFQGNSGSGHAVPFGSRDSGLLWFFNSANWEMLIKVLDGCGLNDHFWVFAAATTNVEYRLEIEDRATGLVKSYFNPLGTAAPSITDTAAFATCSNASIAWTAPEGGTGSGTNSKLASSAPVEGEGAAQPVLATVLRRDMGETFAIPDKNVVPITKQIDKLTCDGNDSQLCLNQSRFQVEVSWHDFANNQGVGRAVPFGSDDSGIFWFFNSANWEMLVKVLDGCGVNQHFWVFSAATTDVGYTLRVTDRLNGRVVEYENPLGRAAPATTDTAAFSCNP